MSRFTFVMFEGGGNVPVQLAIARRLAARGHAVRVLGSAAVEPSARAVGCAFAPFRHAPQHDLRDRTADRVRDWEPKSPIGQFGRFADAVMFGPAAAHARDVLEDLERAPADALAVDYLLFGAMAGAERSGLPTATLMHTPYSLPAPGVPPFGMGFRPARGVLGRMRDRVLGGLQVRTFEKLGRAPLGAARASLGLPAIRSVLEQPIRADRVLVMTNRAFDFAGSAPLPEHVVYTGAELDDPAWSGTWTSPWPGSTTEPLVVVALGSTYQAQGALTQRVADALGGLPVRGLITLGGVLDPGELKLPPNVIAVRAAPHRAVLPDAALVVAHGGHGTVMKALSFGRKVVCVPLGRDQGDVAVRVEVAGAGLRAKPGASTAALREVIARALGDEALGRGAETLRSAIAEDVAADRAVVELEALAAPAAGRSTPAQASAISASVRRSGTTRSGVAST